MRITTKGRYALKALANLAATSDGSPKPVHAIAAEEEISPEFLEQLFFRLKKAGILTSVRGPGGGFTIVKQYGDISLKDIFLAVDEGLDLTPCTVCTGLKDEEPCNRMDHCIVTSVWQDASDHILQYFERVTLQSVLDDNQDRVARMQQHRAK